MNYSRKVVVREKPMEIEVTIDELRLATLLARKAVKNKTKVAKRVGGMITGRIKGDT